MIPWRAVKHIREAEGSSPILFKMKDGKYRVGEFIVTTFEDGVTERVWLNTVGCEDIPIEDVVGWAFLEGIAGSVLSDMAKSANKKVKLSKRSVNENNKNMGI